MGRAARRHARAAARGNPPGGNQSRRRCPLSRQPGCALNSAAHARELRLSGLKSSQIAKLVKPSAAARRIAPDEHRYQIRNFTNLKRKSPCHPNAHHRKKATTPFPCLRKTTTK